MKNTKEGISNNIHNQTVLVIIDLHYIRKVSEKSYHNFVPNFVNCEFCLPLCRYYAVLHNMIYKICLVETRQLRKNSYITLQSFYTRMRCFFRHFEKGIFAKLQWIFFAQICNGKAPIDSHCIRKVISKFCPPFCEL